MRFARFIPPLLVALLALATGVRSAAGAPARFFEPETIPASPSADTRRAATIEAVRFGFGGYLASDAWGPIRVYLSGNPSVDAGAFAGTLTLDFGQDASQSASISVNVATTPGRIVPVEIIAPIPVSTPSVRLRLHDANGRPVHERLYWQAQYGEPYLPANILEDINLIVVLADRSGSEPSAARALPKPEDVPDAYEHMDQARAIDRIARCVARDEDLPQSAMGYEGTAMVIARSDALDALAPAQMRALGAWVDSGGCLAVLAVPGRQSWMGALRASPPIEMLDPQILVPGPAWRNAAGLSTGNSEITGRTIRLTAPIPECGWRVRWACEGVADHNGEPERGVLAEGPSGLGRVVVLGVDPALLGTSSAQSVAIWRDALRHALGEIGSRPHLRADGFWRSRGSGPDAPSRMAIRAALDEMAAIPPMGDWTFLTIILFLVLLAIATGPVDAHLMRRTNLRPWSWATSFVWIALASILAATVPALVRSGDSTMHRLRVVDRVQDGSAPAYQTSLTSLFANGSEMVRIEEPGEKNGPPVGWFRGVSASPAERHGGSRPLAVFPTTQGEIRLASGGAARVNAPGPRDAFSMGQWTLRSFASSSPAMTGVVAPAVRLTPDSGGWRVEIAGLGAGLIEGRLRIGNQHYALEAEPPAPGETKPSSSRRFRAVGPSSPDPRFDSRALLRTDGSNGRAFETFVPGSLLELPGPRSRTGAVEMLLASGGWACVTLFERDATPSLTARPARGGKPFVPTESVLWRIVLPLVPADRMTSLPLPSAPERRAATKDKP